MHIGVVQDAPCDVVERVERLLSSLGARRARHGDLFELDEVMSESLDEAVSDAGLMMRVVAEGAGAAPNALIGPRDPDQELAGGDKSTVRVRSCRHEWTCLRKDRVHNRGNGKYQAYRCRLCGAFQRR